MEPRLRFSAGYSFRRLLYSSADGFSATTCLRVTCNATQPTVHMLTDCEQNCKTNKHLSRTAPFHTCVAGLEARGDLARVASAAVVAATTSLVSFLISGATARATLVSVAVFQAAGKVLACPVPGQKGRGVGRGVWVVVWFMCVECVWPWGLPRGTW